MIISLPSINSNYDGFESLINIAARTRDAFLDNIEIDMSAAKWIDANMCAPLGAILYKVGIDLNTVRFTNIQSNVEVILSKNGFLSHYGWPRKIDFYGTTIEYKRFEPKDDRYFSSYIDEHLIGKGIPEMSPQLTKKFRESIYGIFSNAVLHSQTKLGIFSCGQSYQKRGKLDFSIADLGIGIKRNIEERIGLNLPPDAAIIWALEGRNTTKTGRIPGGLGFKLLRDFIEKNEGRMQIISDKGYWELSKKGIKSKVFPEPFPGTVVNIEINMQDEKSYCLSTEIREEDIF